MTGIILCGGLGTRLYPLTKDIPKSLIPFNGDPFIKYIIKEIYDIADLIVIVHRGYRENYKNVIYSFPNRKKFVLIEQNPEEYGTFIPLIKCKEYLFDDSILINGDTLIKSKEIKNTIDSLYKHNLSICLSILKKTSRPKSARVIVENNLVKCIEEHNPTADSFYHNCGIYALRKNTFNSYVPQKSSITGEYEFTDMINFLCKLNQCGYKIIDEPYIHINSPKDILESLNKLRAFSGNGSNAILEQSSFIEGDCDIGNSSIITNSYIYKSKIKSGEIIKQKCIVNDLVLYEIPMNNSK